MYAQYVDFLKEVNADTHSHTGRTFLAHLEGTYALLRSWGCDDEVCNAGLFHSIYGTNAFETQCVPFDERERIRALIGTDAERLAYLFCVTSRPAALLDLAENGWAIHRISRETIPVDQHDAARLLEIECANLIEQGMGRKFFASLRAKEASADAIVKPEIAAAIRQYMETAAGKSMPPASIRQLPLGPLIKQSHAVTDHPIQLRLCQESDVEQLLWLARELHVDSRYASIPYRTETVKKRLLQALKNPQHCCLLALCNDEVIGFLLGSVEDMFFAKAQVGICRFLYAVRHERGVIAHRLLRSFMSWAKKMGARECRLEDTFGEGMERSQQLFTRLGMQHAGGVYALWL